jgi:hypothetical protein
MLVVNKISYYTILDRRLKAVYLRNKNVTISRYALKYCIFYVRKESRNNNI